MRRWLLPLILGIVAALTAHQAALVAAPRVLMSAAINRVGQAGTNRMFHGPLATEKSRAIVRPSPDLAYSSCPFDLSDGPIRISVPPIAAPYWSLSVFDARTDAAYVRNNGDTRSGGINVVLARPGQVTPAGAQVIYLDGDRGIALVRVLVEERASFPSIDTARKAARCGPA